MRSLPLPVNRQLQNSDIERRGAFKSHSLAPLPTKWIDLPRQFAPSAPGSWRRTPKAADGRQLKLPVLWQLERPSSVLVFRDQIHAEGRWSRTSPDSSGRLMKLARTERTLAGAAAKAEMDEKTARKYRLVGRFHDFTAGHGELAADLRG